MMRNWRCQFVMRNWRSQLTMRNWRSHLMIRNYRSQSIMKHWRSDLVVRNWRCQILMRYWNGVPASAFTPSTYPQQAARPDPVTDQIEIQLLIGRIPHSNSMVIMHSNRNSIRNRIDGRTFERLHLIRPPLTCHPAIFVSI